MLRCLFLKSRLPTIACVVAGAALFCGRAVRADELVIPGGGGPEVLLRALADAFNAKNPADRVSVPPSSGAVAAITVAEEKVALARTARPFTAEEAENGLL